MTEIVDFDNLTQEGMIRLAWTTGCLDYKVRDYQQPVWERINQLAGRVKTTDPVIAIAIKKRFLVLNISRRWGKTYLDLLIATILCIENNDYTVYLLAPTAGDANDIVGNIAAKLFADCPGDLLPEIVSGEFRFRNGSMIYIGGTWNGARGKRGRDANAVIADEAAFIPQGGPSSCLSYVLGSVVSPMLLTTGGWLLITTTPPPNMKHDYVKIFREAEKDGIAITLTIHDNKSLTPEQIEDERITSFRFDPSGSAWKREFLAELVPASNDLIIPSQTAARARYEKWELPNHFEHIQRYIILDHGTVDLTAVLYGYYDYANNKKVVQHEMLVPQRSTTDAIAALVLAKKKELWGDLSVFRSVGDSISHQLIIDINDKLRDHNIQFVHPSKTDLEAMVNQFIMNIDDEAIIFPDDGHMIKDTINSGTWKVNASGKREFARLNEIGHCDFLAAGIYFVRMVIVGMNPYVNVPLGSNQWRNPHSIISTQNDTLAKALAGPQTKLRRGR